MDVGFDLPEVERVAPRPNRNELGAQVLRIGDRVSGICRQSEPDDPIDCRFGLVRERRLAHTRAMARRELHHDRRVLGARMTSGGSIDEAHPPPVEDAQMDVLAGLPAQKLHMGASLGVDVHVDQHRVAELEQLEAQPVLASVAVLVEQSDLAQ